MYFDIYDFNPNLDLFMGKTVDINENGFIYGNAFKDEYVPYKNYKVYEINPNSEESKLKIKLMEESFTINDLKLYLDVNPNDKDVFKVLKKHIEIYENLKNEYESKYLNICIDNNMNDFNWTNSPWPWEDKYV